MVYTGKQRSSELYKTLVSNYVLTRHVVLKQNTTFPIQPKEYKQKMGSLEKKLTKTRISI